MKISVEIDLDQMAEEIMVAGHEEAMRVILAIDIGIADAGFTEELIVNLWNSLRGDLEDSEVKDFLNKLMLPSQR